MGLNPSDRKYDANQRLTPPQKYQPIGADVFAKMKHFILNHVIGGQGIRVERSGEKTIIHLRQSGNGFGGMGSAAAAGVRGLFVVPTVEELPAVPTLADRMALVFWTSAGDGTGDNQVWWTYYGLTRWYPMTYSTLNGTPGLINMADL